MKKPGLIAASVVAATATTAAVSVSHSSASDTFCNSKLRLPRQEGEARKDGEERPLERDPSTDKFAPRFDGLRFIETLVTAHR